MDRSYFWFLLIALAETKRYGPDKYVGRSRALRYTKPNASRVCRTKACVEMSDSIKDSMNQNVDPCDNFYKFVCDNFSKTKRIPEDDVEITSLTNVYIKLYNQLHTMVKEPITNKDLRPFKMVKHLFNVCMNESAIDDRGVSMLLTIMNDSASWPVLEGDQWDADSFDWLQAKINLWKHSITAELFSLDTDVDLKDPYKRVLSIAELGLDLDPAVLVLANNSDVKHLNNYMVDILVLFGANRTTAVRDAADVVNFEINMAKIATNAKDRRDPHKAYNPMDLQTLQQNYTFVDWKLLIENIFRNVTKLKPDEKIIVAFPDYFHRLGELINKTEKRTIANYMFWNVVVNYFQLLPKAFRMRKFQYNKKKYGIRKPLPRWQSCLGTTFSSFGMAVSTMYVRNFFSKSSKAIITDMAKKVRHEMLKVLININWMDEETRTNAIKKQLALKAFIAYPDELFDDQKLEEYYEKLDILGDPFFEAILKQQKFHSDITLRDFRQTINKTDWKRFSDVAQVNAYYIVSENSIQILAGILQDPIFSPDVPQYLNFATVGFIIGHEITHAFDDRGRYFDKNGKLDEWWKQETSDAFINRSKCVVDEANKYSVPTVNLTINGIKTQGENIADVGGAMLALKAYNTWAKVSPKELRLIGMEQFTPRQMFWIKAANFWCSKQRKEASLNYIMTSRHSPNEYRVLNFIRNNKDFAKSFHCPVGSKMNPAIKCNVWESD